MMLWQAPAAIPVSPAAVISKPATWQDDEDVFSTLLKYEKEVLRLPTYDGGDYRIMYYRLIE